MTSLEHMVEKFMNQGANKVILIDNKADAEKRLEEVAQARQDAQAKFQEMKAMVSASGIGGTELSREIYDKLDDQILDAKNRMKNSKDALDKIMKLIANTEVGAKGLDQR